MSSLPKISVILPAVNEEGFIGRAITSIKNQNYDNVEIIVSTNGSTDGTAAISQKLGAEVVSNPKKAGASKARNDGANHATGDILVFLDADSFIGPNTLERIAKKSGANTFGTVLGWPDESSPIFGTYFWGKNVFHRLGLYKGALGGLMFFNKDLFKKIAGYDENLIVDEIYDISRRAREQGGKYALVTKANAYTSLRRFKKLGTFSSVVFWWKTRFKYWFKKKMPDESEYSAF